MPGGGAVGEGAGNNVSRTVWTAMLVIAVLWPSRALSTFDGLPLDGTAEAIALGVVLPMCWIIGRSFLDRPSARIVVLLLLAVKIAGAVLLTQQGLCARFSTAAPFRAEVLTIPIEEPTGALRSWDVRADWRAADPGCTAIVDRPYPSLSAFPAWFLNITDFVSELQTRRTETMPRRIVMDVRGAITVAEAGSLALALDRDVTLNGEVDSIAVSSSGGSPVTVSLGPGEHPLALHLQLTGEAWRFVPTWNGRDAFRAASLTIDRPHPIDRWLAPLVAFSTSSLVVLLLAGWMLSVMFEYRASPLLLGWIGGASGVLVAAALLGRFDRFALLGLLVAPFVPLAPVHRSWRGAMLLVGVPWMAFFAARSFGQPGHVSPYSVDDWLAYQVAGYRIYLSGFWLEAGNKVFDYQPLYRWISGALHLVFGDSSVGEGYWDALCLLAGGMLAYVIVAKVAEFRWAVLTASATLVTFAIGTIWYFVGRGLSEISAAGFAFAASLCLLRIAGTRRTLAVAAGALAVLMFYTRLNHLVFAGFLVALSLPFTVASAWRQAARALRAIDLRTATAYLTTFAAGVALFALRTWWYTGVFSIFYGTSLKNNDLGLRPSTIASPAVWSRIGHSLSALVWMNEPPHPDVRAIAVVIGAGLALLALLQVPRFTKLPLALALVIVGSAASSLLAHTHNYPGRMSIHLVPFAVAMTAVALVSMLGARPAASSSIVPGAAA
jgi:hypothetical protein